jgi:hypothetical protein
MSTARINYLGGLPTGSATTTVFDTTDNDVPDALVSAGVKWFVYSILNDEDGELKAYWSLDGGTNWHQHYSSGTLSAPAAGTTNDGEVYIEHYRDWKIEWVNGGTNQTTFEVSAALTEERSSVF